MVQVLGGPSFAMFLKEIGGQVGATGALPTILFHRDFLWNPFTVYQSYGIFFDISLNIYNIFIKIYIINNNKNKKIGGNILFIFQC